MIGSLNRQNQKVTKLFLLSCNDYLSKPRNIRYFHQRNSNAFKSTNDQTSIIPGWNRRGNAPSARVKVELTPDVKDAMKVMIKEEVRIAPDEKEKKEQRIGPIRRFIRFVISFLLFLYIAELILRAYMQSENDNDDIPNPIRQWRAIIKSKDEPVEYPATKFKDVVGLGEVREELEQVCDYMNKQEDYINIGTSPPKGILLSGKPGIGKTLLGRALAGELNIPFYFINASNIDSMFVGSGSSRLSKLFKSARKHKSGAIIFLDEIDAIGGRRSEFGNISPYSRLTINKLLNEMDGFKVDDKVIVVASTNAPEVLDPALTRSGRFDVHIRVPVPCKNDRVELLEYYLSKVAAEPNIDTKQIADKMVGSVGADFKNIVNIAAQHTTKMGKELVDEQDINYAIDRHVLGLAQKHRFENISEVDKKVVAFREAGKAVVSRSVNNKSTVKQITIIPRNGVLGKSMYKPLEYSDNVTKEDLIKDIQVLLSGRLAEEDITTELFGERNQPMNEENQDFAKAKKIATNMVKRYGMGNGEAKLMFHVHDDCSDYLRKIVETEVQNILQSALAIANDIVKSKKREITLLSQALLEYETVTGDELEALLKTHSLDSIKELRNVNKEKWEKKENERKESRLIDMDRPSDIR